MTVLDFFESLDEFDIDDYEEPEGDYSEEIEDCESPKQVFRQGWTSAIGSVRDSVGKIQDVAREAAGQLKTANEEIESLKLGIEQNSIIAIVYRVESHEQYEQDYSEFGYPIYADDIKQEGIFASREAAEAYVANREEELIDVGYAKGADGWFVMEDVKHGSAIQYSISEDKVIQAEKIVEKNDRRDCQVRKRSREFFHRTPPKNPRQTA